MKVLNILLGMNLQFDIQATEFVQILHIDGNHWRKITRPSKRACSEVIIELLCKFRQPKYGPMAQCDKCMQRVVS